MHFVSDQRSLRSLTLHGCRSDARRGKEFDMTYDSMDFDCVFRSAKASDYDELRQFIETAWMELYSPHVSKRSVERFQSEDGAGQHLRLYLATFEVAVVGGSIVGSVNTSGHCITALFVRERYRYNGIGSSLLHNAEICGGRYLEVPTFNAPAVSFYERRGWVRGYTTEEESFGTTIGSLVMMKVSGG